MRFFKFIILTSCILLMILGLASCKDNADETKATAEYVTVSFNSTGGSQVDTLKILKNSKATRPADPERDGYIFNCWTYDGKEWDFSSDKVTASITLEAKWIDASTVYSTEPLENGVRITAVKRSFENMLVPSVIGGRPVVAIGEGVFEDTSSEITSSITVASSVVSVGDSAFRNCVDVNIVIKGELTEVGEFAFFGCNKLAEITLGEGLTRVSAQSFSGCVSLTSLSLPSTLDVIEENAFEYCEGVVTITMHGTLGTVMDGAFLDAGSLRTVYFYGTEQQKDDIDVTPEGNTELLAAMDEGLYYYSETRPTESGKYWYVNDNGMIRIWGE